MYSSFRSFLLLEAKQLQWDKNPKIGWWRDANPLVLYHETHISNLKSIMKSGLNRPDPRTGMISMALEPNTANGYAAMFGGESNFRRADAKAQNSGKGQGAQIAPKHERVVLVFHLPADFAFKHYDHGLGGNIGFAYNHMRDEELYKHWDKTDKEYYATAELRISTNIPAKYLHGYMVKP